MDEAKVLAKISEAEVFIVYTPVAGEPDFDSFLKEKKNSAARDVIPPTRQKNPEEAAAELSTTHSNQNVCLLIPGREFDRFGTRHGRGGGWYDRFLHHVPRGWFRVGVLSAYQLSDNELSRERWDEPMDALLIHDRGVWRVVAVEN